MVASNRIIFFNHLMFFMAISLISSSLNDFCNEIRAIYCIFIQQNMIFITYILI
jgi:hypothetical protein